MKNRYRLYMVQYMKGMLMYDYVNECYAFNIIEAENYFETTDNIRIGEEYVITISK